MMISSRSNYLKLCRYLTITWKSRQIKNSPWSSNCPILPQWLELPTITEGSKYLEVHVDQALRMSFPMLWSFPASSAIPRFNCTFQLSYLKKEILAKMVSTGLIA